VAERGGDRRGRRWPMAVPAPCDDPRRRVLQTDEDRVRICLEGARSSSGCARGEGSVVAGRDWRDGSALSAV